MKRIIPLHQNESYWLLDEELMELIKSELDASIFSTYPEYERLKDMLAEYAGVPSDSICVSPGSDAAISLLTELCTRKGQRIILPVPTFYGYERILARHGADIVPTYYSEKDDRFEFPLKETLANINDNCAIFLCHPNNPLGCIIEEAELEVLFDAAKSQNALVVLDEAYYEYGGTTNVDRVLDQPMAVLRTLSKAFGLSGARIGYAVSSPDIIRSMQRLQLPWPIAHSSAVSALVLLKNEKKVARRREAVLTERDIFKTELAKVPGIEVFESATNFLLARTDNAAEFAAKLKERGILVAVTDFMTGFDIARELLASTLRIAIPSPDDREYVLDAFHEVSLQLSSEVV
jgi:histidinol-phosphate aminotransferase